MTEIEKIVNKAIDNVKPENYKIYFKNNYRKEDTIYKWKPSNIN